jgi:hypothetical protein
VTVIGVELETSVLVLTKGRDFRWNFVHIDENDVDELFPDGSLYLELASTPTTTWTFVIDGVGASLKVESEEVDLIKNNTRWQLVFKPAGEAAGGDPIARGFVVVQS